tara:strand:- start:33 stop:698 length:666 start_codon:yes stop_codon:yes gene_type:complete
MENHYVYYSYEEFGRGYIGCRTCEASPEKDSYMGSFHDESFNPSHKIILETFHTREEALQAEVNLHEFYQVDKNPHFANKSKQKTTGFYYSEKKFGKENPFYGKSHSEETKKVIRQHQIENNGYVKNRRSYEGENNPFYGKTHSEETKELLKEKSTKTWEDKPHPWIGRKHSEESKAKFRENNKGEKNPNFGKKHSEETLIKMKEARKLWWEKKRQQQSEA